jgi:serine/threonine-protein kinase RsbW
MQSFSETYNDLDAALDDVRQMLDDWLESSDEAPMSTWVTGDADTSSAPPSAGGTHKKTGGDRTRASETGDAGEAANSSPSRSTSAKDASSHDRSGTEEPEMRSREESIPYDLVPPDAVSAQPAAESSDAPGRPSVLRYVQVVLHEWFANLIQHADFGDASPRIEITVRADQRFVSCSVIDNSRGFDLSDALATQRNEARALPERGMGLRIISACTEQCAYRSLPDGRYRFKFSIPVDHDPWLSTLF